MTSRPTLADALAPGLSAEERARIFLSFGLDDKVNKFALCGLLDAHARDAASAAARDARRKTLEQVRDWIGLPEQPSGKATIDPYGNALGVREMVEEWLLNEEPTDAPQG